MQLEFKNAVVQYGVALQAGDHDKAHRLMEPFCSHSSEVIAASACYFAGLSLVQLGDMNGAMTLFEQAVTLGCQQSSLYELYGTMLIQCREHDKARTVLQSGLKKCGPSVALIAHMAGIEIDHGSIAVAERLLNEAVAIDKNNPLVWNNLGHLHGVMGRVQRSLSCFQQALSIQSNNEVSIANLLLTLNYLPLPKSTVCQAHRLYPEAVRPIPSVHRAAPRKAGKIRVAYLSSDFRFHAVAFFFLPLLISHNRDSFEVFCYIDNSAQDDVTQLIRNNAFQCHDVHSWSDNQLAEQIVQDDIDILVDLAGHSIGRRLALFKAKPARQQLSYLGYPNTLGIAEMDYRIVDAITDPEGEDDHRFPEKLKRIGSPFVCFSTVRDLPEVSPLPTLANGHITFGSLNRLEKMSEPVIELWSALLARVPGAKLLLKSRMFASEEVAAEILKRFADRGIGADRLILEGWKSGYRDHLRTYQRIDIALDTFPYNGTTTTCEALIMGVPVVTLKGDRHAARVSASMLNAVGLDSLVAETPEQFVVIAERLGRKLAHLRTLRSTLRQRVTKSPLMDGRRLAGELEAFYQSLV